jgi:putative membrane protein
MLSRCAMHCWLRARPVASEPDFRPERKLHPLSWVFALLKYVRQLIVPLLAFLIFGARNNAELWGAVILVPLLIGAVWQQWLYRYGFGPRGLVIHEGLFFRNVRQIEYPRIENIDVQRGPLHRLFGVAEVSIATSTGGKPEASIRVLSLDAVQDMREHVFARTRAEPDRATAATEDETLLHLPPSELVRYGLIDNRGMIVVAALFGFLYQSGFFRVDNSAVGAWLHDSRVSDFAALGHVVQAAFVLSAVAGVVLTLRLLSIVLALVTLFDFTLTRHGHDFRVRYGLLTRLALTVRVRRIQSVHQTETLLHRWFGRVSLRVDLAGDSGVAENGNQKSQTRTRWLAPICSPAHTQTLIAAAFPDIDLQEAPEWQPLAPRARGRLFRRTMYGGVVLLIVVSTILELLPAAPLRPEAGWILAILIALLLFAWTRAHIYVKNTRWALTRDALLFRHGWLTRRLVIAPRNRLQSVLLTSSPFDRRYGMANVAIDTAGGGAMRDSIHIPLLPEDVADGLATALYGSRVDTGAAAARQRESVGG